MNFTAAENAALERDLQRLGVFFRIDTDPVERLWCGVGKIEPGVNAFDLTGASYKGFGEIGDVPALNQLINGQADRVELSISGKLPIETMIGVSMADVRGKQCAIGFALMDGDWQLIGPVRWLRRGRADALTASQMETQDPEQPIVRSVRLSVGSLMTNRRRSGVSYLVDYDQKRRSQAINPAGTPDRFCERTTAYSQQAQKVWPRF